ncbi:MAG: GNAT family N-acetyltransferase [Candidatus Cloacimonetes bacterium]|nr:GNAT family N-acetyltransferase [Candidatus Cloacimonadota bacterium]
MDAQVEIFHTKRLRIIRAEPKDADFISSLWNNPEIMKYVGFPEGLHKTAADIIKQINSNSEILEALLIIETLSGKRIGQCKLGKPDKDKISATDIKLLPEEQGKGYGTETKHGLLEYLFTNTDCEIVQATPNIHNIASIKMQKKAGGILIKKDVFYHQNKLPVITCPVEYFLFYIYRSDFFKE